MRRFGWFRTLIVSEIAHNMRKFKYSPCIRDSSCTIHILLYYTIHTLWELKAVFSLPKCTYFNIKFHTFFKGHAPRLCCYHPIDDIRIMVIVWRLRGNIIRTAPCWVVWHNVHSQQHTHVSSSYRSSRLGLSHWDPYTMRRGVELYYCNVVEWCLWDSGLICKTNWFPSVLWHCWFGHMTCKTRPRYDL